MAKILNLEYENPKTHAKSTGKIEIRNQTPGSAELYFYGDICASSWDVWQDEDMCPQDVADFLSGLSGIQNINIYINSGGGDSQAGKAIYNILSRNGAHMEVYNDGLMASAAGLISMVGCMPGNVLHMPPGSQFMMHKCWTIGMGNAEDFRSYADQMDKCDASYVEIFSGFAVDGVTSDNLSAMLTAETWMNGEQMADVFKNIDTTGVQIAASLDPVFLSRYKHVPKSLVKGAEAPAAEAKKNPPLAANQTPTGDSEAQSKALAMAYAAAALALSE